MPKRALITGGSGFVGRNLSGRLEGDGYSIYTADKRPSPAGWKQSYVCDLADRDAAESVFEMVRPDVVIHLAAIVSVPLSLQRPRLIVDNNPQATLNVCEMAAAYGVEKFVFTSTCAVYGDTDGTPVQELAPTVPISLYGAAKLMEESLVHQIMPGAVVLRLGNVWSHHASSSAGSHGVVTEFREKMMAGEPVTIFGEGVAVRDYIHVFQVCKAIQLSLKKEAACGEVLNIGSGSGTSVSNLFEIMRGVCPVPVERPEYKAWREGDVSAIVLDTKKASEILGFKAWAGVSLENKITPEVFD